MKSITYPFLAVLLFAFVWTPVFSQDKSGKDKKDVKEAEAPKTNGLKRITPEHSRHFDFDEEDFDARINEVVDRAMHSVQKAMERMEVKLSHMNVDVDIEPIRIHIPQIDIDPIDVDIDLDELKHLDLDLDMDLDHHNSDEDDDGDHHRIDKSDKKDSKEKAKGLKKISKD